MGKAVKIFGCFAGAAVIAGGAFRVGVSTATHYIYNNPDKVNFVALQRADEELPMKMAICQFHDNTVIFSRPDILDPSPDNAMNRALLLAGLKSERCAISPKS